MCLGVVGQVLSVESAGDGASPAAIQVTTEGRVMTASMLAMSDIVRTGDWVLMHSGLVLGRLTEHEARDALELRNTTERA